MDFIERVFGFSPDGGSGTIEFFLFALPLLGVLALRHRYRRSLR